jgi:hypothetical protein
MDFPFTSQYACSPIKIQSLTSEVLSMPFKRFLCAVLMLPLLQIFHFEAVAQSQSRSKLEDEISTLKKQLLEKEKLFLDASAEDRAAFAEFLKQPNTGLIRLLPRTQHDRLLTIRGGGAYYSFARLTHEYGYGSDIELQLVQRRDDFEYQASRRRYNSENQVNPSTEIQESTFMTGFAGADYGFLVNLGKVPLDKVTLEHEGVTFLASYVPPSAEPEARAEFQRARAGIGKAGFGYKSTLPVLTNNTYVLRSINYNRSDVLVALRVVRMEGDASVILLWKRLKRFSRPELVRADPPKCQPK